MTGGPIATPFAGGTGVAPGAARPCGHTITVVEPVSGARPGTLFAVVHGNEDGLVLLDVGLTD